MPSSFLQTSDLWPHQRFNTVLHQFNSTQTFCVALIVYTIIPYTYMSVNVSFTISLNCSLPVHFTFASLRSSDFVLHAFSTPSSHLVQGYWCPFLASISDTYTFLSTYSPLISSTFLNIKKTLNPLCVLLPLLHLSILIALHKLSNHLNSIIFSVCISSILKTQVSALYVTAGTTLSYNPSSHPKLHSWP